MSKLPQDIIVDILTYLPVKSLVRFKCVCKPWQLLISDPRFVKLHLKRAIEGNNINRQRLLVAAEPLYSSVDFEAASDGDGINAVMELPYPSAASRTESFAFASIRGSCDGLVCIRNGGDVHDMFLWNPSTRESKKLPKPSSSVQKHGFLTGLGYDSTIDDYKLVIACLTTANGSHQIMAPEVFTLKTNSWRRIQGIHSGITLEGGAGVFWNGALHWLGKQETGADHDVDVIFSLDVAQEKFMGFVPLPNHFCTAVLSISGNCLCIFGKLHPDESYLEAWITSEYGVKTSWRRRYAIPFDRLYMDYFSTEMCLTKKGVLMDHHGCPGTLQLYDPVEDATKLLRVKNNRDPMYDSAVYTESLVSLR
jgi:F-box interacting protein